MATCSRSQSGLPTSTNVASRCCKLPCREISSICGRFDPLKICSVHARSVDSCSRVVPPFLRLDAEARDLRSHHLQPALLLAQLRKIKKLMRLEFVVCKAHQCKRTRTGNSGDVPPRLLAENLGRFYGCVSGSWRMKLCQPDSALCFVYKDGCTDWWDRTSQLVW